MIDMDDFKPINDQHGHLAGDRVLRTVCERVQRILRRTDVFGRYGGDEFLVVLPRPVNARRWRFRDAFARRLRRLRSSTAIWRWASGRA
jgi:diguanylate cyclase (GGDEF)-like protein